MFLWKEAVDGNDMMSFLEAIIISYIDIYNSWNLVMTEAVYDESRPRSSQVR